MYQIKKIGNYYQVSKNGKVLFKVSAKVNTLEQLEKYLSK